MPPLYKEGLYWLILRQLRQPPIWFSRFSSGRSPPSDALCLLGFSGLQPLLYRDQRKKVLWDERETLVAYTAVSGRC